MKKIYNGFYVLFVFLFVTISNSSLSVASVGCGFFGFDTTALNIPYLKNWISSDLNDEETIDLFRPFYRLRINYYPEKFNLMNFDFEKSGLNTEYAAIEINIINEDVFYKFDSIVSVSFWQGRDFIMIKTENEYDLESYINKYKKFYSNCKIKLISDEVILFCS